MSGIYWLASYPKSGNTWLRLLLHSCVADGATVDTNEMAPAQRARIESDHGQVMARLGYLDADH